MYCRDVGLLGCGWISGRLVESGVVGVRRRTDLGPGGHCCECRRGEVHCKLTDKERLLHRRMRGQ